MSLLLQSAEEGCRSCGTLEACIRTIVDPKRRHFDCYYLISNNTAVTSLSDPLICISLYLSYTDIKVQFCQVQETYRHASPGWVDVPDQTDSDESLAWAKERLESCIKHHNCSTASHSYCPTRVLDVSFGNDPDYIRVVDKNETYSRQYFALSHCWGKPDEMTTKLTVHTHEEYRTRGLVVESLPQTFKDAVQFTRNMGYQYLWIDSLCIIQRDYEKDSNDDKSMAEEDWKRESGKMCSVYQNSHLTLAAAWGRGCRDGLFYRQNIAKFQRTMPNGFSNFVFARETMDHDRLPYSPLFKRSWAFQERLLSPRTLYFSRIELVWSCKMDAKCQCGGDILSFDVPKVLSQEHIFQESNHIKVWHDLLIKYGLTTSSHGCDRLAAIEGLAKYLNPQMKRVYLAGLWQDSFWEDFMWTTSSGYGERTEQTEPPPVKNKWSSDRWLFPTWSWASIIGIPEWQDKIARVLVGGVMAYYEWNADTPYKLHLEGVVVLVRVSEPPFSTFGKGGEFYPDYDISLEGKGFIGREATIHCLRVSNQDGRLISVALHCVDETNQLYERIGIVYFDTEYYGVLPRWWTDGDRLEPMRVCLI